MSPDSFKFSIRCQLPAPPKLVCTRKLLKQTKHARLSPLHALVTLRTTYSEAYFPPPPEEVLCVFVQKNITKGRDLLWYHITCSAT
jgi:hypothetical protein